MREKFARFNSYMKYRGLNDNQVTQACNLSQGLLGQARIGKSDLGPKAIDKILNVYQDINRVWLLTGEGDMLKDGQQNRTAESKLQEGLIPFYDAETTGGYNGRVSSSNEICEIVGYIYAGGWFAGRETAAIRHVGESMAEYPNGCILAVREVLDRNLLVPGKNYVVETSEYRVTKRIQRGSSKDTISLYSTNQEKYEDGRLVYEPFEVRLSDVRRIFSVLGYIVNQSGEFKLMKI